MRCSVVFVEASCHKHFFVFPAINTAAYYKR